MILSFSFSTHEGVRRMKKLEWTENGVPFFYRWFIVRNSLHSPFKNEKETAASKLWERLLPGTEKGGEGEVGGMDNHSK